MKIEKEWVCFIHSIKFLEQPLFSTICVNIRTAVSHENIDLNNFRDHSCFSVGSNFEILVIFFSKYVFPLNIPSRESLPIKI